MNFIDIKMHGITIKKNSYTEFNDLTLMFFFFFAGGRPGQNCGKQS